MPRLNRQSVETCIMAAFERYRNSTTGTIRVPTTQGNVDVTCVISGDRFNTGFPGYSMSASDVSALRTWCGTRPGNISGTVWAFGFRGTDRAHPDSINITLINLTRNMFNFHIYLT